MQDNFDPNGFLLPQPHISASGKPKGQSKKPFVFGLVGLITASVGAVLSSLGVYLQMLLVTGQIRLNWVSGFLYISMYSLFYGFGTLSLIAGIVFGSLSLRLQAKDRLVKKGVVFSVIALVIVPIGIATAVVTGFVMI